MNLIRLSLLALLLATVGCKKDKKQLPDLDTCKGVTPTGSFIKVDDESYRFEGAGGATLLIERNAAGELTLSFGYSGYPRFTAEWWGDGAGANRIPYAAVHENLHGKHIKDRVGNNRTMLYPDGTKITCVSSGPFAAVTAISIYDGNTVHHFNVTCNVVEYSAVTGAMAKALDNQQADGETSSFEITSTGLNYFNIYNEETPGNKVEQRVELGRLYKDFPNRVDDFYDDPRLAHT